jgi:two-component system, chemotaxis family, sensor kinase CheA
MSDEIVREFLVEGNANLDTLDCELIQLEKDPHNRATLASVFRTIHTIKGTCGFLGFTKLKAVAHIGENLLSKLRDGELVLNPKITTALLRMVDAVRQMLQSIEAIGNEGERDDEDLILTLTRVTQGGSLEDVSVAAVPAAALVTPHAAPNKKVNATSPAPNIKIEKKQAPLFVEAAPETNGDSTEQDKSARAEESEAPRDINVRGFPNEHFWRSESVGVVCVVVFVRNCASRPCTGRGARDY